MEIQNVYIHVLRVQTLENNPHLRSRTNTSLKHGQSFLKIPLVRT